MEDKTENQYIDVLIFNYNSTDVGPTVICCYGDCSPIPDKEHKKIEQEIERRWENGEEPFLSKWVGLGRFIANWK